jgi:hypothetical protein
VQFAIAMRLASVRPSLRVATQTLLRSLACAAAAFLPAWVLLRTGMPLVATVALAPLIPLVFVALVRRAHVLEPVERERVRTILARRAPAPVLDWFVP